MLEVRFLGHAAVWLSDGQTKIIIDPFLTGNPKAALKPEEVEADLIVVTHAHGDHWGDSLELAKRDMTIVSSAEIAGHAGKLGAPKTVGMNTGGTYKFKGGWLKWFPAWHTSSFPDGTYGGIAMGVLLELGGKRVYHAGDTALFSDLKLVGDAGVDLALVPIGDHFTMGPEDALKALELLRPQQTVPIHYNTFPPIVQDGPAFVTGAGLLGIGGQALDSGGSITLS